MTDLVKLLRDEDSYYRIQEKHWCIDSEELERQRLAAADRIEELEAALLMIAIPRVGGGQWASEIARKVMGIGDDT